MPEWTVVGPGGALPVVEAHDLSTNGTTPTVAYADGSGTLGVLTYDGVSVWTAVGSGPVAAAGASTIALEFNGGTPIVATQATNVQAWSWTGLAWGQIGAPGGMAACSSPFSIALALNGGSPHVAGLGAGGCGVGSYHTWSDGGAWAEHPDSFNPGLIGLSGVGPVDVVYAGRAYVAAGNLGSHEVYFYDPTAQPMPGWVALDGDFAKNAATPGMFDEPSSLWTDGLGTFWVAWAEDDGTGKKEVWVARNTGTGGWTAVGGRVSGSGSATDPSISDVGGEAWLAYTEEVGGVSRVFVRRWDGAAWRDVGGTLNIDPSSDALEPRLEGIAGVGHVAFREMTLSGERLHVLAWQ
jgi:hypothetical protein